MSYHSEYIRSFIDTGEVHKLLTSVTDIEIIEYHQDCLDGTEEVANILDENGIDHNVVKKIIINFGQAEIQGKYIKSLFPEAEIEYTSYWPETKEQQDAFINHNNIDTSHILVLHFALVFQLFDTDYIRRFVERNSRMFYVLLCNPTYQSYNTEQIDIPQPFFNKREYVPTEYCKDKQEYIKGFVKKYQWENSFFEGMEEVENGCNECCLCDNYDKSHKCPLFQHFIASMYRDGNFVPQNKVIAHNWDLKASNQGYDPARRVVANDFRDGIGCDKDVYKAESMYKQFAYEGDVEIAKRYVEEGEKTKASREQIIESIKWRTRLANDGDFMSILKIANIYRDGKYGMPKDEHKHIDWLIKGSEAGSTVLTRLLEDECEKTGNGDKSFILLKTQAEKGDGEAEYKLSQYYREEPITDKKLANANRLLEQASNHNCKEAQEELANRLYWGDGISIDYARAFSLYHHLYENGDVSLRFRLAYMYGEDLGTSRNYDKSFQLYSEIADSDDMAMNNLACLYGAGHGVEQNFKKAAELFEKSAEEGNSTAQCNIGRYYQNGMGVEKDEHKAIQWFEKSAEQDYTGAYLELGLCYELGKGVDKDYVKAADYYLKAANRGDSTSMTNLALAYNFGRGVEKNHETAAVWFKKAAELDNSRAQYWLGLLNENKEIDKASKDNAIYWYRKSARNGYSNAQEALKRLDCDWIDKEEKL